MTNLNLHIIHKSYIYQNKFTKYICKYPKFSNCDDNMKYVLYNTLLSELTDYYNECSCLTESDVCEIFEYLNSK